LYRLTVRFIAALVASLALTGVAVAVERLALVIGNSAYQQVPYLPNPINDARSIADTLTGLGFSTDLKLDLGVEEMRATLLEFEEKAIGSQIAVIYYAGHGIEVGGSNYLIPVDAVLQSDTAVDVEAIPLSAVLQATSGASKLQLIMLDACRNNPFLLDIEHDSGRTVGKGLARIEPEGSTLVSLAASAGMTAFDGAGDHSPYTTALLQHLPSPGLEVNYVFRRVNAAVRTYTANAQQPIYYQTLDENEIYLTDAPANAVALSEEDRVRVAYEDALDLNSVDAYNAFLGSFPEGYYASLARERIAALALAKQQEELETAPLEDVYWITIRGSTSPRDFEAYLRRYPDGIYADLAQARIEALSRSEEIVDFLADGEPATDEMTLRRKARAQLDQIPFNMIQYGLVALGFVVDDINGILDPATRRAVRAYQASIDAPQTGKLDEQQTIDVLLAAASVGDQYAQMTLGVMLAEGIFWERNYGFARMWLARSANQDNPDAMTNLAIIYRDGLGTAPDEQRARLLLRRAVSLGSTRAGEVLRALELT
jgi:uncharacterized caspase-like protein